MPEIFADFRWREVITIAVWVATVVGFFVIIMIDVTRDLDQIIRDEANDIRPRIRDLEVSVAEIRVRLEVERILRICAERPEVCED